MQLHVRKWGSPFLKFLFRSHSVDEAQYHGDTDEKQDKETEVIIFNNEFVQCHPQNLFLEGVWSWELSVGEPFIVACAVL